MKLEVRPKKILVVLVSITLALSFIHLATQALVHGADLSRSADRALNTFYMANEISVPTWYNQVLLFLAAFVAGAVSIYKKQKKSGYWKQWALLGLVMLFLSIDEGSQLHEQLGFVSYRIFKLVGLGNFSTTYYYLMSLIMLVAVVCLLFVKFWWKLPVRTKVLLFVSAVIYVGAAVGVEAIGQYNPEYNMTYSVLVWIEETLEMLGIVVFIYALLDYVAADKLEIRLSLKD